MSPLSNAKGPHFFVSDCESLCTITTSLFGTAKGLTPQGPASYTLSAKDRKPETVAPMFVDLSDKSALVTGSTRGIGYEVARQLGVNGAQVVVNGRTQASVDEALNTLSPYGIFIGAAGDITSIEGVQAIAARQSQFDIVISNAALFDWIPFFETTDEDWLQHFQTNVLSAVRLARHYLQGMLERDWGRIVLVASESGLNIPSEMIHYGVSKAAETALGRGLAELTAGTGVTVNTVLPGPTRSSGSDTFLAEYAAQHGIATEEADRHASVTLRPTTLLQRMARVEEVANMVLYACSREASATNGAALRVEGGILRHVG